MPDPNMSPEEAEHVRKQAQEALHERRIIADGDTGETQETVGDAEAAERMAQLAESVREMKAAQAAQENGTPYNITPASEDGTIPESEDDREEIITAFVVFINADGKAIATSEIDKVLEGTKRRREADIADFRRACAEVVEDTRALLQTQSMINTQMQMAQRVQEAQKNEQLLQGLNLNKVAR